MYCVFVMSLSNGHSNFTPPKFCNTSSVGMQSTFFLNRIFPFPLLSSRVELTSRSSMYIKIPLLRGLTENALNISVLNTLYSNNTHTIR